MSKREVLSLWRKVCVLAVLTAGLLFTLAPSRVGAATQFCDVPCPEPGWRCIREAEQDRCVCDTDECCMMNYPGDGCCGGQCTFFPRAPMCDLNMCGLSE
jgi:hypothetical protein